VCAGTLAEGHIAALIESRERTQRFTGIKLARLRREAVYHEAATTMAGDAEEDVYIRLEAASYLSAVCHEPAHPLFDRYLSSGDEQTQLEAVIALGETATDDAVVVLSEILADNSRPYFLRSAAAWSLGRTRKSKASDQLIRAFSDVDIDLRDEALDGLVEIGEVALPLLLRGLRNPDGETAAGCAEALRRHESVPSQVIDSLVSELQSNQPRPWAVWLAGNLPREHFTTTIAQLQTKKPELHFALSVLWSFVESWIARTWQPRRIALFLTSST
jgi:HEAT repeat protein